MSKTSSLSFIATFFKKNKSFIRERQKHNMKKKGTKFSDTELKVTNIQMFLQLFFNFLNSLCNLILSSFANFSTKTILRKLSLKEGTLFQDDEDDIKSPNYRTNSKNCLKVIREFYEFYEF